MRILVRLHPKRIAVAPAVFSVVAIVFSPPASAHSFLIRSQPEAGARLAHAPATMTLYFSEAFVRGSQQVTLRNANGETLKLSPSKGAGTVIRQPLPRKLRGVFVVSWRVLSDDGHISLGEFAFAVGSTGALPAVRNSFGGTSW